MTDETPIAALARRRGWDMVVAFGSRARGEARPESDLDIAILRGQGSRTRAGLETALSERFLDVNWLDESSWLMWREVSRDGQLLFEASDGLFQEFAVQATLRSWAADEWRNSDKNFIRRVLGGPLQLNFDLVRRKAAQMAGYLHDIEPLTLLAPSEFAEDKLKLYAAERLVELLVECAGTLNTEVGQAVAGTPPSDYYSSFFALVNAGWISQELAVVLADWARMRNNLVHRYDRVATEEFLQLLSSCLPPWQAYLKSVADHLDSEAGP